MRENKNFYDNYDYTFCFVKLSKSKKTTKRPKGHQSSIRKGGKR